MELIQVRYITKIEYSWFILGQAYILALKNGDNSIIINGAANAAYDPNMTELDPAWAEVVRTSNTKSIIFNIIGKILLL